MGWLQNKTVSMLLERSKQMYLFEPMKSLHLFNRSNAPNKFIQQVQLVQTDYNMTVMNLP